MHNINKTNFDEPVLGDSIITWPNFMVFGNDKFNPNKRKRYRHHDQFKKGATAELWPTQMEFTENIQQDSWWMTQPKKYQVGALNPPGYWEDGM